MERLTGIDAGFLYMETPTLHMHTLKISIVDPTTVPGGYSFARVGEVLGERLHLVPPFRRRLVEVPGGLHHPLWVEDPEFDLAHHLHRAQIAAPGGPRQLGELISDIASRQLDRRYPLWELWVVEGIEHDHIGFVAKIHHAVADGVAAAAMLANVLEAEADPRPVAPPSAPWRSEAIPPPTERLVDGLRDLLRNLASLPGLLRRTVSGLAAVIRRRRSGALSPPLPFSTPRTSFNRALTPNRWFAMTSLPLDEVKAVRRAFDATVNDVVLALCAGALRRYLDDRGELPDRPLLAGVPVSAGTADQEQRLGGNKVSNLFTSLRTDIADPVERLRAIHDVTQAAKEVQDALGSELLIDWSEITPPRIFAAWMRLYSRLRLADRHRPPINLVVSNVPGPRQPLHIAGGRLLDLYSMGPILEGIGLNITVWSYVDRLGFGLVACRETMPDIWDLADHLRDALAELLKAAQAA
ncbi:MAG TPA: wax ester/triacylglycerol synthase family O-acyltransferase [Acidimicrobiales bacterium]|nr:wax ester/triacylglycerol synthase family O-acyltransferase [Acidimicrobiales bacterium]